MNDRHAAEISAALNNCASAVKSVGWAIVFCMFYSSCLLGMLSHH